MRQDKVALFPGLVICSDCGHPLNLCRTASMKHTEENYTCGIYRRYRNQCTAHYIRVVVLERLVLQNLQRVVAYAQEDEDEFVMRIMENKLAVRRTEQEQSKRKLEKQKRRITELDAIIQRLYEDNSVKDYRNLAPPEKGTTNRPCQQEVFRADCRELS